MTGSADKGMRTRIKIQMSGRIIGENTKDIFWKTETLRIANFVRAKSSVAAALF